jgi:hypothetical protein
MIFDHIEALKQQYTDKYVVVDDSRPELQRFRGQTGAVKTVNMSGRALVEFDAYNNIGWYDIDLAFLKIVDAPAPKPVETKKDKAAAPKAETPRQPAAGEKPIGEKKSPAAAAKPAAAPAAGKSVADILAAARKPAGAAPATPAAEAKPAAAAPAKVAPGGKGMSMDDILAAARGKKPAGGAPATPAAKAAPAEKPAAPALAPAAPAKVAPGGKGMSMDDILAMARGKKAAGGAAPVVPAAQPASAPEPEPDPAAEEPAAEEAAAETATPAPAAAAAGGTKSMRDEITTVAEQIAYCRKVDSK